MIKNPESPGDYLGQTFYGDSENPHSPTHIWKPNYSVDIVKLIWVPLNQEEKPNKLRELELRILALETHLDLK